MPAQNLPNPNYNKNKDTGGKKYKKINNHVTFWHDGRPEKLEDTSLVIRKME